jgi:hypothetical protein
MLAVVGDSTNSPEGAPTADAVAPMPTNPTDIPPFERKQTLRSVHHQFSEASYENGGTYSGNRPSSSLLHYILFV